MNSDAPIVYVVDDDSSILKAVSRLLGAAGFTTKLFTSPCAFLNEHNASTPGCILLDLAMPDLNGLDLQRSLASTGYVRPIVFITGHGDIPASVNAMKAGASDFLTKPFDAEELIGAVRQAIETDRLARETNSQLQRLQKSFGRLTLREKQVFKGVINGRLNKQIAAELGIVEKTVKVHRSRVMTKMGVHSLAELVQLAGRLGMTSLVPTSGPNGV
jgi:FixJ family two-component response regulator